MLSNIFAVFLACLLVGIVTARSARMANMQDGELTEFLSRKMRNVANVVMADEMETVDRKSIEERESDGNGEIDNERGDEVMGDDGGRSTEEGEDGEYEYYYESNEEYEDEDGASEERGNELNEERGNGDEDEYYYGSDEEYEFDGEDASKELKIESADESLSILNNF